MTNFGTVLFYCLLIILFPIAAFFTSKTFLFDGYLRLETVKSNIYSACVAVIALHIALGKLNCYSQGYWWLQEKKGPSRSPME